MNIPSENSNLHKMLSARLEYNTVFAIIRINQLAMRFSKAHLDSDTYLRRLLYAQLACAALAVGFGSMDRFSNGSVFEKTIKSIPFVLDILAMGCLFSVVLFPIAAIVICTRLQTSAGTTLISWSLSAILSWVTLYGLLPSVQ
ncbi:MAG: hypothetical protein HUJ26_17220 [Planctomycetaceae bacterium]|nr:hypothetical protein [Planctomycetaceae bacterium]